MKVRVINKNLNDLQDKIFRPIGAIFECDNERAYFLLKNKAVEVVEEVKEEKLAKININSSVTYRNDVPTTSGIDVVTKYEMAKIKSTKKKTTKKSSKK